MNWQDILIPLLAIFMGLTTCGLLAVVYILAHIAHGEPDANGDPERDAGLDPQWRSRRAFPTTMQSTSREFGFSHSATATHATK